MSNQDKKTKLAKAQAKAAAAQAKYEKLARKSQKGKTLENVLIFGAVFGMVALATVAAVMATMSNNAPQPAQDK